MAFSRRRRRFSGTRRPRRKMAWTSAAQSACGSRLTVTPCDFEGVDLVDPDYFNLVHNPAPTVPGQVDQATEVTVLRIVGDLAWWASVSAANATEPQLQNVLFYWGVYIGDVPNLGGSRYDPTRSDDAAAGDWMARGVSVIDFFSGTGATNQSNVQYASTPGAFPHFDLKVKRKLRQNEEIILAVKVLTDNPFPAGVNRLLTTAFLYANMRALVALP